MCVFMACLLCRLLTRDRYTKWHRSHLQLYHEYVYAQGNMVFPSAMGCITYGYMDVTQRVGKAHCVH